MDDQSSHGATTPLLATVEYEDGSDGGARFPSGVPTDSVLVNHAVNVQNAGSGEHTRFRNQPPLASDDDRFLYSVAGPFGGTSFIGSVISITTTAVGVGVLGLLNAVAQTGWIGLVILCVVCAMARATAGRLVRCQYAQKPERKLRTYAEVGYAAFGSKGEWATIIAQMSTLLSASALYTILGGINLNALALAWGAKAGTLSVAVCTIISGCVVAVPVVVLRTMREISWIATIGFLSSIVVVLVITIFGIMTVAENSNPEAEHTLVKAESIAYSFATFVFAFSGHSVFPTI